MNIELTQRRQRTAFSKTCQEIKREFKILLSLLHETDKQLYRKLRPVFKEFKNLFTSFYFSTYLQEYAHCFKLISGEEPCHVKMLCGVMLMLMKTFREFILYAERDFIGYVSRQMCDAGFQVRLFYYCSRSFEGIYGDEFQGSNDFSLLYNFPEDYVNDESEEEDDEVGEWIDEAVEEDEDGDYLRMCNLIV